MVRMDRNTLASLLRQHGQTLRSRFGVRHLAFFGSVARNEATETSDVDLLVTFSSPPRARQFFELQFYLEDLLHRPVDLVTDKALRAELRPHIEKELVDVL